MSPFLESRRLSDAPICTAHKADTGQPCKAFAIRGGTVCVYHGGASGVVRAKALERLAALVDPAITKLQKLIDQSDDPAVAMRAVADLLDRAGFRPADQLKLSGDAEAPLEIIISRPVRKDAEPTDG